MERRERYYQLNGSSEKAMPGKLEGAGKLIKGLHSRTVTEDEIDDPFWYRATAYGTKEQQH